MNQVKLKPRYIFLHKDKDIDQSRCCADKEVPGRIALPLYLKNIASVEFSYAILRTPLAVHLNTVNKLEDVDQVN